MTGTATTGTVPGRRAAAGLGLIVLAAAAILFRVVFGSPVITNYAIYALIFVAVVSAWNLFSGFSGYISLGQAVFFGSGAYAVASRPGTGISPASACSPCCRWPRRWGR